MSGTTGHQPAVPMAADAPAIRRKPTARSLRHLSSDGVGTTGPGLHRSASLLSESVEHVDVDEHRFHLSEAVALHHRRENHASLEYNDGRLVPYSYWGTPTGRLCEPDTCDPCGEGSKSAVDPLGAGVSFMLKHFKAFSGMFAVAAVLVMPLMYLYYRAGHFQSVFGLKDGPLLALISMGNLGYDGMAAQALALGLSMHQLQWIMAGLDAAAAAVLLAGTLWMAHSEAIEEESHALTHITPDVFSVAIKGLPPDTTSAEVAAFVYRHVAARRTEVHEVTVVHDYKYVLSLAKEREALVEQVEEVEAILAKSYAAAGLRTEGLSARRTQFVADRSAFHQAMQAQVAVDVVGLATDSGSSAGSTPTQSRRSSITIHAGADKGSKNSHGHTPGLSLDLATPRTGHGGRPRLTSLDLSAHHRPSVAGLSSIGVSGTPARPGTASSALATGLDFGSPKKAADSAFGPGGLTSQTSYSRRGSAVQGSGPNGLTPVHSGIASPQATPVMSRGRARTSSNATAVSAPTPAQRPPSKQGIIVDDATALDMTPPPSESKATSQRTRNVPARLPPLVTGSPIVPPSPVTTPGNTSVISATAVTYAGSTQATPASNRALMTPRAIHRQGTPSRETRDRAGSGSVRPRAGSKDERPRAGSKGGAGALAAFEGTPSRPSGSPPSTPAPGAGRTRRPSPPTPATPSAPAAPAQARGAAAHIQRHVSFSEGVLQDLPDSELKQRLESLWLKRRQLLGRARAFQRRILLRNADAPAVAAFVIFESRKAASDALTRMHRGWCSILSCGARNPGLPLFRNRHVLDFLPAPRPSDVLYENLGFSWLQRMFLMAVTEITALLLLLVSLGVLFLSRDIIARSSNAEFAAAFVPFGIAAINFMLNASVRIMTKRIEKHHSLDAQETSVFLRLFLRQTFNSAVFVVLVNSSFTPDAVDGPPDGGAAAAAGAGDPRPPRGVVGRFSDLEPRWYSEVGSSLVTVQILNLAMPHVEKVVRGVAQAWAIRAWRLAHAAGQATKIVTQQQLNALFTGPILKLSEKYAQLLAVAFCACMFSTGLPLLLVVAAVVFAVSTQAELLATLHLYRLSPMYGLSIARTVNRLMLVAVALKLLLGIWALTTLALPRSSDNLFDHTIAATFGTNAMAPGERPRGGPALAQRILRDYTLPHLALLAVVLALGVAGTVRAAIKQALACLQCRQAVAHRRSLSTRILQTDVSSGRGKETGFDYAGLRPSTAGRPLQECVNAIEGAPDEQARLAAILDSYSAAVKTGFVSDYYSYDPVHNPFYRAAFAVEVESHTVEGPAAGANRGGGAKAPHMEVHLAGDSSVGAQVEPGQVSSAQARSMLAPGGVLAPEQLGQALASAGIRVEDMDMDLAHAEMHVTLWGAVYVWMIRTWRWARITAHTVGRAVGVVGEPAQVAPVPMYAEPAVRLTPAKAQQHTPSHTPSSQARHSASNVPSGSRPSSAAPGQRSAKVAPA